MAEVNVRVSDSGRLFPDAVVIKVDEQEIIAGQDGISPVVTVTEIGTAEAVSSHGYEVDVSDAAGVHTYSVYDGASAYAQAVAGGYSGTEEEFAADLIGFNTRAAEATAGATAAAAYADAASDSATAAATSESNAADSATAAASSASEAASSAGTATTAAGSASSSATAAAGSATTASNKASEAASSESNAASSATAASASAMAAAASETAAASSASSAAGSATAAAASAAAIEEYEHDAEAWAIGKRGGADVPSTDDTYHNNSKYYAEQAAASSTTASSAASAASQSAQDAAASATAASQSKDNAASSATAAAGSATAAAGSASTASTAATTAQGHATNAASSATAASGSATAAANKATAAAQSATAAGNSATEAATAREAAEGAQDAAEAAAQSIAQSAAQIAQNTSDIADLKDAVDTLQPAATAADIGKALIVKTVADGKPTEYEYGEAGGGGDATNYAPIIINSASGDIASFADGADGLPVKQLTVNVEPIQAGSGDPSPENVRPISGRTSATVTRTGKNLLENELTTSTVNGTSFTVNADGSITVSGTPTARTRVAIKRGLAWDGREAHVFSFGAMPTGTRVFARRIYNGTQDYPTISPSVTTTIGAEIYDIYLEINTSFNGTAFTVYPQLELGSTATAYEPYAGNTYTIQLGDTVYGGTLDVTAGKMVVDRAMVDLGTLTWGYQSSPPQFYSNGIAETSINWQNWNDTPPLICSRYKPISNALLASSDFCIGYAYNSKQLRVNDSGFTDAASFKTAMSGVQLVYELATPIEITLTPTQIETLLGKNNLWADAGDVSVDYRADTKLYIDNIHTPTDDDMTADAQIASGKYFIIGGNLYFSTTTIPAGDTIIPGTNCTKTNLADALNALNA